VSSCGRGSCGQLGLNKESDESLPIWIQLPVKIVQVAAGGYFSACLGDDGRVFVFGANSYGQLGLGDFHDRLEPVEVPNLNGISSLSCGYEHTCCLDFNGQPFTFGYNSSGQLGHGTKEDSCVPQQVNLPDRVIQIASGNEHTVFLSENHSFFVCGSNGFGQLGLRKELEDQVRPVCVPVPDLVRFVACGGYFTLLITQENNIFSTRKTNYGQLCVGEQVNRVGWCQFPDHHTQFIVCGSDHWIFISDDDGALYGTGYDGYGQLGGIGSQDKPVKLMDNPLAIGCSLYSSFILTDDGIMCCGYNQWGGLGLGHKENPVKKWTTNPTLQIATQLLKKPMKGAHTNSDLCIENQ